MKQQSGAADRISQLNCWIGYVTRRLRASLAGERSDCLFWFWLRFLDFSPLGFFFVFLLVPNQWRFGVDSEEEEEEEEGQDDENNEETKRREESQLFELDSFVLANRPLKTNRIPRCKLGRYFKWRALRQQTGQRRATGRPDEMNLNEMESKSKNKKKEKEKRRRRRGEEGKEREDSREDEFGSLLLWPSSSSSSSGDLQSLGRRKGPGERKAEGEREEEEEQTNSDLDATCGQPNVGGSCSSGGNNSPATGETRTNQETVTLSSQVKEEQATGPRPMDNNGHWQHRQKHQQLDNLQVNNKQRKLRAATATATTTATTTTTTTTTDSNKLNYSKIFRQYLPTAYLPASFSNPTTTTLGQVNQTKTTTTTTSQLQSLLATSQHSTVTSNNNHNNSSSSSFKRQQSSSSSSSSSGSYTGTKFTFKFKSKSSKSEQRSSPVQANNQDYCWKDDNKSQQQQHQPVAGLNREKDNNDDDDHHHHHHHLKQKQKQDNKSNKQGCQFEQRRGRSVAQREEKSVSRSLAFAWSKFKLSASSTSHPSSSSLKRDNQRTLINRNSPESSGIKRKEFLYLKGVRSEAEANNANSIRLINQTHKTRLLDDFDQQHEELYPNCDDNNNQEEEEEEPTKVKHSSKRMEATKSVGKQTRSSSGDRTALISFLALSSTFLLACVILLSNLQLASGLQPQQQPPFTRSQLQPTSSSSSSSSGAPNGQQSTGSGGVGGGLIPAELPPQSLRASQPGRLQGNGPASQQANTQGPPQPAAGSLVATINCNKIRGHVTLTPNVGQSGGPTTVTTQISAGPPGEVYQWSVHQFPVKPGAAMCSCSPLVLGTKLIDLSEMHGNLPASDQEFSVQSSLQLFGSESPVGHSLLLRGMKTGMLACATFLPTSRKSNYRAKFHSPISGSVTIFQTAFGTSFISHLMYSNGTRRHSQHRFDLIVKSDDDLLSSPVLGGGSEPLVAPSSGRNFDQTQAALEQREHENELQSCKRFATLTSNSFQDNSQQHQPLFKNLTHQLSVSTENFGMRGRTALVLPPIPFETFASVYVVIYSEHDPGEAIACAPLRFVKAKTAAAKFQSHSVQGSVVFSQDSPYDVTLARINLNFPNSDGHSYGIDELPMIIRRKSDTRVCPNIREIIYNPHHVEPSSVPPEGEATSDQYAVGDLSGKYGSLTGKATEKIQASDYNLPLFGPVSVIGRALTIYSSDGVAIACSNVELTSPMTTAFATFDYGIQGQFIFRQPMNDCNGDTYVYIEVSKPTSGGAGSAATSSLMSSANEPNQHQHQHHQRSIDHNWHIHTNPVDSGLDHLSTTDCAPAGGHFNPYNTSTSSIYSRDCTPFNVLRCELGDLSAKMFTIEIPPYRVKGNGHEPDIGKFFGTDIDLPLCGPASVVNRSVVVHVPDFGSQRLACSTVIEFKPRN